MSSHRAGTKRAVTGRSESKRCTPETANDPDYAEACVGCHHVSGAGLERAPASENVPWIAQAHLVMVRIGTQFKRGKSMKTVKNALHPTTVAGSVLLLLVTGGFSQAADVYHLQDSLHAIICEDGRIFSYQGSEEGLAVVVPALCEEHGGVAGPDGGGGAVALEAARRPAQGVRSTPGARPGASSSADGPESSIEAYYQGISKHPSDADAASATGSRARDVSSREHDSVVVCWGRGCPAGSEGRTIDKASPALARTMAERCGGGSGKVSLSQFRQANVHQCPIQRTGSDQFEDQRRR